MRNLLAIFCFLPLLAFGQTNTAQSKLIAQLTATDARIAAADAAIAQIKSRIADQSRILCAAAGVDLARHEYVEFALSARQRELIPYTAEGQRIYALRGTLGQVQQQRIALATARAKIVATLHALGVTNVAAATPPMR